jgi:hypothetical protein
VFFNAFLEFSQKVLIFELDRLELSLFDFSLEVRELFETILEELSLQSYFFELTRICILFSHRRKERITNSMLIIYEILLNLDNNQSIVILNKYLIGTS